MKNVLITGGAGYVGSLLVPQLIELNYNVVVYDTCYFYNTPMPTNLEKADIRDHKYFRHVCGLYDIDTVIHLACISNDASFELDEKLSTSINLDAFEPLVVAAKEMGVSRFIYASTSSVYGISEEKDVTEDHPLVPLTLYNEYKAACEPLLFKHQSDDFTCVIIRPATLCGTAPRMRFDLTVNLLTNHAIINNEIKVFGGEQQRPNLHIQDMCDLYALLLCVDKDLIAGKTFNCARNNSTVANIALTVQQKVLEMFPEKEYVSIKRVSTDDKRSYHVNSDKIRHELGFFPRFSITDAIEYICWGFKDGKFPNSMTNSKYYNVYRLKNLEVK